MHSVVKIKRIKHEPSILRDAIYTILISAVLIVIIFGIINPQSQFLGAVISYTVVIASFLANTYYTDVYKAEERQSIDSLYRHHYGYYKICSTNKHLYSLILQGGEVKYILQLDDCFLYRFKDNYEIILKNKKVTNVNINN